VNVLIMLISEIIESLLIVFLYSCYLVNVVRSVIAVDRLLVQQEILSLGLTYGFSISNSKGVC
jgi:hypothetical protein